MKPENWSQRMELSLTKMSDAIIHIGQVSPSPTWAATARHTTLFLQNHSDAAELLVKATMERRGVPADRTHDIAALALEFSSRRPADTVLAQQISALNGNTRSHHTAMYDYEPPKPEDMRTALARLVGSLGLWTSEVTTPTDIMASQYPDLLRIASLDLADWLDHLATQPTPKQDNGHPAQPAAEALLHGRAELYEAITLFRDRIHRAVDAQPG